MNRRNLMKLALWSPLGLAAAVSFFADPAAAMKDIDEPYAIASEDRLKVPRKYRRREVNFETSEAPGTIIVDTGTKFLYFVLGDGRAMRYGIGVGRQGFEWSGEAVIRRKAKWPRWTPPKNMVARDPLAAKWASGMPGGPENPLGARALYLFQGNVDTLYRIHGTFQPDSIGKAVSSGCVRLLNADVADLYERTRIGAKVVVLPASPRMAQKKFTLFSKFFPTRDSR